MGGYIYSVLCASLCAALLTALSPDNEAVSKYVAFAGALCVALCVLTPFIGGLTLPDVDSIYDADNIDEGDNSGEAAKAEYMARNAILSLSAISGADTDSLSAQVEYTDEGVKIILRADGIVLADKKAIGERLSEILEADITVYDGSD